MLRVTPKELKTTIAYCYTKPTTEILSAASCTLIEQSEGKLGISNYEPGRSYHTRYLKTDTADTGGEVGTKYLVDTPELMAKVARLQSSKTLTFFTIGGVLTINSNYSEVGGVPTKSSIVSLRQYGGSFSDFPDFKEVVKGAKKLATLTAKRFLEWLLIKEFGEFTDKSEGDALGHTVSIAIKDNQINGLTRYKGAHTAYMNCVATALTPDNTNQVFELEGLQFKKLSSVVGPGDLADQTVSIYLSEFDKNQWITFKGEGGVSTLKSGKAEDGNNQVRMLFNRTSRVVDSCVRGVELKELEASATAMKPSTADFQDLLFTEEGYLKCSQANALSDNDWSSTDLIAEKAVGDWTPILLNAPTILVATKTLGAYLKQVSANSNSIELKQRYIQNATKRWILYLDTDFSSEDVKVSTCIVCKEAELFLDQLDDKE